VGVLQSSEHLSIDIKFQTSELSVVVSRCANCKVFCAMWVTADYFCRRMRFQKSRWHSNTWCMRVSAFEKNFGCIRGLAFDACRDEFVGLHDLEDLDRNVQIVGQIVLLHNFRSHWPVAARFHVRLLTRPCIICSSELSFRVNRCH
jgi:hypothetical protein